MTLRFSARAFLAPVAVTILLLSGCGSSGPQAGDVIASATDAVETTTYPLPDCTGQDPEVCAQDGFDPAVHGFSFPNWGAVGELGATEMVALFGRSRVCTPKSPAGRCILYPAARAWLTQANEGMAGGHCEGMAVMSERLFLGAASLGTFDPAATATYDLSFDNALLKKAIDLWFITQALPDTAAAARDFRALPPSQIAAEIAAGFASRQGYTLGIYSEEGGHAVTPLAVTREGDLIAISVYDNNFPGTVQRIMVDPANETWNYAMGSTNPDNAAAVWSGTTGTMDLTPMASRSLPEPPPFGTPAATGAVEPGSNLASVLVTSADPRARVGVTVTVDGRQYDLSDPTVAPPPGVRARPMLAGVGFGGGESVTIDTTRVKEFRVTPRVVGGTTGRTPIALSIDSLTRPRVTLRSSVSGSGEEGTGLGVDGRGQVTVAAADGRVGVANGLSGVEFPVTSESDVRVDEGDADGVVHVSYVDESGAVLGTYDVAGDNLDGDAEDTVVEFDPVTGEFTSQTTVIEADEVDDEVVQAFDQQSDADSADGSGDGSVDGSGDGADSGSGDGADSGADSGSDAGSDSGSDSGSDPEADPSP